MNSIEYKRAKLKLEQIERGVVIAKPYIVKPPDKKVYGIEDNILENLAAQDRKFTSIQNIRAVLVFIITTASTFLAGFFKTNDIRKSLMITLISFFPSAILFLLIINKKPPETPLHKSYKKYIADIENYRYWKSKNKESYWHSLTGTGFEFALAEVFNLHGYRASLTKNSGDKGVDIILEKNKEIIIVQCKAHKKKISANVAKKLSSSMDYFGVKKSILASVSGFYPGVYDYVSGRNIDLLETKDILEMLNRLETYSASNI